MMNEIIFKFYIVGGFVRDKLLGIKSKDVDYSVVLENFNGDISTAFDLLCKYLDQHNYIIFLKTPECYTIRAKDGQTNDVADFVLARKEIGYDENSRKPFVMPGTLEDDLLRRDFTINALAIDNVTGKIIDICGGLEDLKKRILRTPIDANITLLDDPLRVIRGFRFSITKGLKLDNTFMAALLNDEIWIKFSKVVSSERIRDELDRMFQGNTIKTIEILNKLKEINNNAYEIIFKNITLKPIVRTSRN